jgi:hypothetical protein
VQACIVSLGNGNCQFTVANRDAFRTATDLIEALDWLCKTVRITGVVDGFTLSSATYHLDRCAVPRKLGDKDLAGTIGQTYILRPVIRPSTAILPDSEYTCWRSLFDSCIVVDSPLYMQNDFGHGLETSFDLMISLAAAEFSLLVDGGVVFTGYQTVLYPITIREDCAQFHLIVSSSGPINPYSAELPGRMLVEDPSTFKAMRCFIGWCSQA